MVDLIDNLYLLTVPLIDEKSECDIEDLFESTTLLHEIDGKKFNKKHNFETSNFYGKEIFSKYILKNYSDINFDKFKPLLDNINTVIESYRKPPDYTVHNKEEKNIDKSNAAKVFVEA